MNLKNAFYPPLEEKKNKKYIFDAVTKTYKGRTLYRLISVKNFTVQGGYEIKVGDVGGWVEKKKNLSHNGNCWIYNEAIVYGNAKVTEDALILDNAIVSKNAIITGKALIQDNARVKGHAVVEGDTAVKNNAIIKDYAIIGGQAIIAGDAVVGGNSYIDIEGKSFLTTEKF